MTTLQLLPLLLVMAVMVAELLRSASCDELPPLPSFLHSVSWND